MKLRQVTALLYIFLMTSCSHLLYPADRFYYINKNFINPVPKDVLIPIDSHSVVHGWHFETKLKHKKGVFVHFHGNGQNISTHFQFFIWVVEKGFDYIIVDYRGYGQSSDEEASQFKTVEDAKMTLKYIKSTYKDFPVIAVGQSIGSNILARAVQEMDSYFLPDLMIFDSGFMSYKEAASSVLKQRWFLYPLVPLSYILISDQWASKDKIKESPLIPALFFQTTNDQVIRSDLSNEFYKNWPGEKKQIVDQGGDHISSFSDKRFVSKNRSIILQCIDAIVKNKQLKDCTNISPTQNN